jgi:hypothetical protein
MPVDTEQLIGRYHKLDSDRANWRNMWEDCARYGAPRRMGAIGPRADGDRRISPQIYNPIGIQCVQTLAAAMHGMLMNPATNWLNIRLADEALDEQESSKHWTGSVSKGISNALSSPHTAFHSQANQLLEDMSSLGTAVMYIGQQKTGHLFTRTYPIFECCIAENEYGFVDTVMRDSMYTVRQMVQIWGEKVSPKVYDKGKYDDKFKVLNVCTPRSDEQRDRSNKTPQHMPIAVCYIEENEQNVVEESGVEEMPYVVPRWWVISGEVHGRSPLMTALPQVKVANAATRTVMRAAEKAVDPPLTVPHEGLVGPVRQYPGSLTYLRNKSEIGQMPTSSQLPYAGEYIMKLDNAIRTTMFVDQVQFVGDFKMTATEVIQRQTERMRLLGPVLGRLENEFLNPLVERVFGIMSRLNAFQPPPQEIQGADMRIEYQSPLARAQKSQIAQGFEQVIAVLEPLAKLGPDIAQQLFGPIDMGKVTPMLFDWFGVDEAMLKTDDQHAAAAQQANQKNMMAMVPMLAKAFKDGGMGMDSIASAGKQSVETIGNAQQMPTPQMPTPAPGSPAAGPPSAQPPLAPAPGQGAPGGPGGIDLSKIIGSIAGGAAKMIPGAVGSVAGAQQAYRQ